MVAEPAAAADAFVGLEVMSKFGHLAELKKTKSRVAHLCSHCGAGISREEDYYKEHIRDRFLHSLANSLSANARRTARINAIRGLLRELGILIPQGPRHVLSARPPAVTR